MNTLTDFEDPTEESVFYGPIQGGYFVNSSGEFKEFPLNIQFVIEKKEGRIRLYSKAGQVSDWWDETSDEIAASEFAGHAIKLGLYVKLEGLPSSFSSRGMTQL